MKQTRRRLLSILAVVSIVTMAGPLLPVLARPIEQKPNVIIIFTDDQGYQDIGCFGSPLIKTPNLDRMAEEGRRFTSFYSANSVCSPSRASLLTGCYPPRAGISKVLFPRDKIGLNPREITIADMLKQRGYATTCIGKWHLGHLPEFLPTRQGFDSYFGIPYSNDMTIDPNAPLAADIVLNQGITVDGIRTEKPKKNWVPLMSGEAGAKTPHEAYFYYRGTKLEAVRQGPWKLRRTKQIELYNLTADISETNNLATAHPDIVKSLSTVMERFGKALQANSRPHGKVESP